MKRVGGRDWYFEGATQLLERQNEDGGWDPEDPKLERDQVPPTCFALLFLRRGARPLAAVTGK